MTTTKIYFNELIMIITNGPIKQSSDGQYFIFVIIDAFSHYVSLMGATKNSTYYSYTALFEHWLKNIGLPDQIRSDNGTEYVSTGIGHLCKVFNNNFKPGTTYDPCTNGPFENTNKTLGQFIRTI